MWSSSPLFRILLPVIPNPTARHSASYYPSFRTLLPVIPHPTTRHSAPCYPSFRILLPVIPNPATRHYLTTRHSGASRNLWSLGSIQPWRAVRSTLASNPRRQRRKCDAVAAPILWQQTGITAAMPGRRPTLGAKPIIRSRRILESPTTYGKRDPKINLHPANRRVIIPLSGRGVAQPGSAPAWGAGGRQFESGRPDHLTQAQFPGWRKPSFCFGLTDLV